MMALQFLSLVLVVCSVSFQCFASADLSSVSRSNNRQRRYLSFPNKAVVALTVTLLKNIATDVTPSPTVKVVTIHELDVFFPLPHEPSPFKLTQTALGQTPVFSQSQTQARSRHRRDVYHQLEDLFYLQGHDGKLCVLKALCDAKNLPKTNEENLVMDLLSVLFSLPHNSSFIEDYQVDEADCSYYKNHCSFSIFDLAFGWAEQFSTLYNA